MNSEGRKEGITARADPTAAESTESWPIMLCCARCSAKGEMMMGGKLGESGKEWEENTRRDFSAGVRRIITRECKKRA